jgi:molecular chaperone GrpE
MKKEEPIDKLKEKVKEIREEAREKEQKLKECKKEAKKTDEKDKKIEELTDTLQRLQAEFENYRKYVEKQSHDFRKYAKADLICNLLSVLDSFELALKNTSDKEKFVKGVELIFSQLFSTLEKEGLRPIKAEGEKLDPLKHEVLLKEKSDKEEDMVIEELQKGYMLGEKVIRHSKVKVSRK